MTIRAIVEIVLRVADVDRALGFYRDTLGLELFSPPGLPGKFLRVGEKDGLPMQTVLVPGGQPRPAGDGAPAGLHHIGLEVDPDDWQALRDRLEAAIRIFVGFLVETAAQMQGTVVRSPCERFLKVSVARIT